MLHLQPITESQASEKIKKSYLEIKKFLGSKSTPLVFQYLANFDEYYFYVLERIKKNVLHASFPKSYAKLVTFSQNAIDQIYFPSPIIEELVGSISEAEIVELLRTLHDVETLNAKLLILSLGLRENIKGVFVGLMKLQEDVPFANILLPSEPIVSSRPKHLPAVAEQSFLLAPLFGSQDLFIPHIPDFFKQSAYEVENLLNTEKYLEKRVRLEQTSLQEVANLTYPLGGTYQEIMHLAGQKPHFKELFYLLVETFPTAFPRLLLTTAVMKKALKSKTSVRTF